MPPPLPENAAAIIAHERLRLLSWGYYASAGFGAFFCLFFLMYTVMFGALSLIPESAWASSTDKTSQETHASPAPSREARPAKKSETPPVIIFRIFAGVMAVVTFFAWALCFLTFYAGWCIHKRKHFLFINIMAGYNCLWVPYGTLLGVLSFIVLHSEAARVQFESRGS